VNFAVSKIFDKIM